MDAVGRNAIAMGESAVEIVGETSIQINASPQTIYDYLLDFGRHSEWTYNLSKVTKISDGPIGVGTVFRASEGAPPLPRLQQARMMLFVMIGLALGAKPYSEAEITALEPGRRLAWRAQLPRRQGVFNQAVWEIVLEPRAAGTYLTQRFRYSPQTWAACQMVGSVEGITASTATNLTRLKQRLENSR